MTSSSSPSIDPVPPSAWPSFTPVTSPLPTMPRSWSATVLLQPFGPPQQGHLHPDTPFFELCVANLAYVSGGYFSAQISGCVTKNTWWYIIVAGSPDTTFVSYNNGDFQEVDMGWSMPENWYGDESANAQCAGASPLNWMNAQTAEWWRAPVPGTSPPAATWMWFDSTTKAPVRMMFGDGPAASPDMGDPAQLAILQMYSFSYFPVYTVDDAALAENVEGLKATGFADPTFEGFQIGNPNGYDKFIWNGNFGMTVFMTPVNEDFNPLPTRVLYVWKPDDEYEVYTDRAQSTLMDYTYNPPSVVGTQVSQEALLTGPAPAIMSPAPPGSATSFLINFYNPPQEPVCSGDNPTCVGPAYQFDFPQEPPNWVTIPAVDAKIQATITNNPVLCPGFTITVFSVLFPPSPPNYPDVTYLWTWYSPLNESGTASRPVTFMQSQSGVNLGTSLALADYFYYETYKTTIDAANFDIPQQCVTSP